MFIVWGGGLSKQSLSELLFNIKRYKWGGDRC